MKLICSNNSQNIVGCTNHDHPVYEIVIVTNGVCKTKIKNTVYDMELNSILLIPPKFMHKTYSSSPFSDLFVQVDALPFPLHTPILISDYSGNVFRIMETIQNLERIKDYSTIDDLLNVLCKLLQSILGATYKNANTLSLKTLIEKNLSNPDFSISETAKTLGYNHDYLRRAYKIDTGVTPTEYLLSLRLQQAKKLLKNTNFQISTIALQCGFVDQYYFSRLFKKKFGLTPKEYRNN